MSQSPLPTTDPNEPRINGQFLLDFFFRLRRYGAIIVLIGLLIIIATAVLTTLNQAPMPDLNISKIGVHMLLDDGRNHWDIALWDEHMRYAGQMSSPNAIVVQIIRQDDLEIAKWQRFLDLARDNELTPVLRLATTYDYENNWWLAPEDATSWANDFSAFLNALTWHTDEKFLILLNEPNNGHEWGGKPDPAAYAEFSLRAAEILRDTVDDTVILNAAIDLHAPDTGSFTLSGIPIALISADRFMSEMEAAVPDIFDVYDIWNSHPYPIDFTQAPQVQTFRFDVINDAIDNAPIPPDGIYNRGINGYLWELWKLEQLGYAATKPIMITEFGWRTDTDDTSDMPSPLMVEIYMDMALRGQASVHVRGTINWIPLLADERIIAIAPFALDGDPDEWSHTNLLHMSADGAVLGTTRLFDLFVRYQK